MASSASASWIAIRPSPEVIRAARVDLVWLSPEVLEGLRAGRVAEIAGAAVPAAWVTRAARLFELRLQQLEREPQRAPWLVRAIVERDRRAIVGHVSFHGPPGSNALGAVDALEIGFTIEPAYRRRGFAREAALALMAWAKGLGIHRFLASVSPTNTASLALVRGLGFVEATMVEDEEDGPEIVFERRV